MKIIDVDNNKEIQDLHKQLDEVIVGCNIALETISITLDALKEANSNKANKLSDDNQYTKAIRIAIEILDK